MLTNKIYCKVFLIIYITVEQWLIGGQSTKGLYFR